ncbi:uncharacterized protein [Argopecten irradians]|uniref:uncharacterized protein isoform X2 n=1 Tax=Argopecten irradians TaxID=31199 RepID=UPI003710C3AF
MTIVNTSPQLKGRCTKLAHAIYVCIALLRLIGVLYIVVGSVLTGKDGVFNIDAFPLLNQFVVHEMPLGNFSAAIVYSLFFMFPIHSAFGLLGFRGVIYHKKRLIIIFACFLVFGIVSDVTFITLFSLILDAINSWIGPRFIAYYDDFANSRLNEEVEEAFGYLFAAMNCSVAVSSPGDGAGCWDKYYAVMNGNIRVFIMLLAFNIVLEILSYVLLELIYRRLGKERHQPSSPIMFIQFLCFIRSSFKTNKVKFAFAMVQFADVVFSAMLLFVGVAISQSRMVTDSFLLPIFENMRFNNYYLPGIVLSLAVTMVLIGCLNGVSCGVGCAMLCFKSKAKSYVMLGWQFLMTILFIVALCFWIHLLRVVCEGMFYQLYWEFLVYGGSTYIQMYYTRAWNALFVTYSCCGIAEDAKFYDTEYRSLWWWWTTNEYIPTYCRSGASVSNSDLTSITVPPTKSSFVERYKRGCETALTEEIKLYLGLFVGMSCVALLFKLLNLLLLLKFKFGSEESEASSSNNPIIEFIRGNKSIVLVGSIFFGLGLLMSWGVVITGVRINFDDIFGHKDIKLLFEHIYIFGRDVTSWIAIMSKIMISTGTVSFFIFIMAIVSASTNVAVVHYVAVIALTTSLLFKLLSLFLWIPLKAAFAWNLRTELYSALHAYYITDDAQTDVYLYVDDKNLGFNSLFYQGKCCLQQSSVFDNLPSGRLSGTVPWTCRHCENEMGVRWPFLRGSTSNLCPSSAYTEDCTTTVLDTLWKYDASALAFSIVMMILEVLLIIVIDRVFKSRVSPESQRGLFSEVFLNNRFINENRMPNFKIIALAICLLKMAAQLLQLPFTVGIILEKIDPGYFDYTERNFLNNVFSGDTSLGYVTHALGILLLVITLLSFLLNIAIIVVVLLKWKRFLFGLTFVTIPFILCNTVILGLLCRVLDVAYCCDKSPDCSYRTDSGTFQEFCQKTFSDPIHKVLGVSIAYIITILTLQIVCVVLSDRLYKRLHEQTEASGIFKTAWFYATNNRCINKERMPEFTNIAAVFSLLTVVTMVLEVAVFIGIILEKFGPDGPEYFYTTEQVYLNNIKSGELTLGYVTHVTGIIMFCVLVVSAGLGPLNIISVIKKWQNVLSVSVVQTLILMVVELICLGLLSLVLSVAYCCDYGTSCTFYTSVSSPAFGNMCKHGFHGAVYNVVGTFIGFMVVHLVIKVVTIVLADRIYKRMSDDYTTAIGMFHTFWRPFTKDGYFSLMSFLFVIGHNFMFTLNFSAWVAIMVYTVRGDSQVDDMYVGTLYFGEMIRGTNITLLVFIPFSIMSGVCQMFWCLWKWNTGLVWSTLPDTVRLIVDIVILGLYAQLLESVRLSNLKIYRVDYELILAFLCISISAQIILFVLKDRLHKRIEMSKSITDSAGMVSRLWGEFIRYLKTDSGRINKTALVFCCLSCILVVLEVTVFIGIILEKFGPDGPEYFSTTEQVYLNNIKSGELTLGYVTHVTGIIMFCVLVVSAGLGPLNIISVMKKWQKVLSVSVVQTLILMVVELICLGLLSLVLSVAYCCDYGTSCTFYTSVSSPAFGNMCKHGFHGAVYNVVGTFIGFMVAHLVIKVVTIVLADRIYKHISDDYTTAIGMFHTFWRPFTQDSYFPLMSFLFVIGHTFMFTLNFSAWVAIMVYAVRGDSQVDDMYVGTLYFGEMIRGANITLLVFIPFSIISGVCQMFWSLWKWSTGLVWSTLPDTVRLIVDIVILGLYAQLLESVRLSNLKIYRVDYELIMAFLCISISAQIILFVLKDRLHKRIEMSKSITDSAGMVSRLWGEFIRYLKTDSGRINKTALVFCCLSCILVVLEVAVFIGIILEKFGPDGPEYFSTTEQVYLNNIKSGELTLGYVTHVTGIIMFCVLVVSAGLGPLNIISVMRNWMKVLTATTVLTVILTVVELICLGLLSVVLSVAYCCDFGVTCYFYTSVNSPDFGNLCADNFQSAVYDVIGTFIGFLVGHIAIKGILLGISIYMIKPMATTISPAEDVTIPSERKGVIINGNRNQPTGSDIESVSDVEQG